MENGNMRHYDEKERTVDFTDDVVGDWHQNVTMRYRPKLPVCFVPCTKVKPFTNSITFKSFLATLVREHNKTVEIVILDEPFGIVPLDKSEDLPDYNFPVETLTEQDYDFWSNYVDEWLCFNVKSKWVIYCLYPYHFNLLKRLTAPKKFRGAMVENQSLAFAGDFVAKYIKRMSKRADWVTQDGLQ